MHASVLNDSGAVGEKALALVAVAAGAFADWLSSSLGWELVAIRRLAQSVATLGAT